MNLELETEIEFETIERELKKHEFNFVPEESSPGELLVYTKKISSRSYFQFSFNLKDMLVYKLKVVPGNNNIFNLVFSPKEIRFFESNGFKEGT